MTDTQPPTTPTTLDGPVEFDSTKPLRMSADCMRSLAKATGRTMTELLQDEADEANRIQVIAFSELHRRYARAGHLPDAATLWEQAGAVEVVFETPPSIVDDPLGSGSSTTSPPSAGTGA
jgi:hypothetical protein